MNTAAANSTFGMAVPRATPARPNGRTKTMLSTRLSTPATRKPTEHGARHDIAEELRRRDVQHLARLNEHRGGEQHIRNGRAEGHTGETERAYEDDAQHEVEHRLRTPVRS